MEEEIVNQFAQGGNSKFQINNFGELESLQSTYQIIEKNYLMRAFPNILKKSRCTCILAYSGMLPISFGFNVPNIPSTFPWILDSGATNHMTPPSNYFFTYHPSPSNKKFSTANGTLVTVAGIWDIQITPSIILKSAFHVSKLSTNLVSTQKTYETFILVFFFHSNHCKFQVMDSRRKIEHSKRKIEHTNAREGNGLNYLEEPNQLVTTKSLSPYSLLSSHKQRKYFAFKLSIRTSLFWSYQKYVSIFVF